MRYIVIVLLLSSCLGTKFIKDATRISNNKEQEETTIYRTPGLKQRNVIELPGNLASEIADFNRTMTSQNGKAKASVRKKGAKIYIENIIPGNTDTTTVSNRTFEETTTENTKKVIRLIPWWIWLLLVVFFLPRIVEVVSLIAKPFK